MNRPRPWDTPVAERILPPPPPWDGASRSLIVAAEDPWITPAEAAGLTASPGYDETIQYLRRLAEAAPQMELVSIGTSPEGRELWLVIVAAGVDAFLNGIELETLTSASEVAVEMCRLEEPRLDPQPFEGHARVSATVRAEAWRVRCRHARCRRPRTDDPYVLRIPREPRGAVFRLP